MASGDRVHGDSNSAQKLLIAGGLATIAVFVTLIIVAKSQQTSDPQKTPSQISAAATPSDPRREARNSSSQQRRNVAEATPMGRRAHGVVADTTAASRGPAPVTLSGSVPNDASLDEVFSLLVLPNHEPNPRAIEELCRRNDADVIDALLARLGEPDSPLERAVLETLGELRTPRALPFLVDALRSEHLPLRRSAIGALGKLDSESASQALTNHLGQGAMDDQSAVLEALGNHPRPGVGEHLLRYIDHPEPDLRRAAARSLTQLGDLTLVQRVAAVIDHKDRFVRQQLARTLRHSRSPDALPTLRRLAADDPDVRVRGEAIEGLGEFGDPADRPVIERMLDNENAWIREKAQQALQSFDR